MSPADLQSKTARPVLTIENLVTEIRSVRGLIRPVDGVTMSFPAGRIVGVVGESGSGKSMTAFSIIQLFPTSAARIAGGRVLLGDADLIGRSSEEMRAIRGARIGMIFQDPTSFLNPVLTIGRQIEQQLQAHHWTGGPPAGDRGQSCANRVSELLTSVGLPRDVSTRYPHQLSGGQCQRVGIASALACDPDLIIADEPTTALDVTIQAQILRLMMSLQRERAVALMLITHDLGVVAEVCDYVYVMYAGRIVEQGDVRSLFAEPQHPYTRALMSGVLSLTGTGDIGFAVPGSVPDLAAPPSGCRFHPRCPHAMPRCSQDAPPLFDRPSGRSACWLHDEAAT